MPIAQKTTATADNNHGVADRVRAARDSKNLNQMQLCALSKVSPATLKRLESGKTKRVQTKTLEALAQALDVKAGFLRTGK